MVRLRAYALDYALGGYIMGWTPAMHLHKTGQYYVRVGGKVTYLGRDRDRAVERFLAMTTVVTAENAPVVVSELIILWATRNPGKWQRECLAPWDRFAGETLVADIGRDAIERFARHQGSSGYQRGQERGEYAP